MLKRIFTSLFKGRPVDVPNTKQIEEGHCAGVNIGDVAAGGTRVILCRVEGRLHAIDSLCPHEGGRIATGRLFDGKYALCPLHNYLFDPRDGKVVRGACARARTFRVEEREGATTLFL